MSSWFYAAWWRKTFRGFKRTDYKRNFSMPEFSRRSTDRIAAQFVVCKKCIKCRIDSLESSAFFGASKDTPCCDHAFPSRVQTIDPIDGKNTKIVVEIRPNLKVELCKEPQDILVSCKEPQDIPVSCKIANFDNQCPYFVPRRSLLQRFLQLIR